MLTTLFFTGTLLKCQELDNTIHEFNVDHSNIESLTQSLRFELSKLWISINNNNTLRAILWRKESSNFKSEMLRVG